MQIKPLVFALGLALSSLAQAGTLTETFEAARAHDAEFAAARAAQTAGQEAAVQGRAALLPQVNATGNLRYNDVNSTLPGGDKRFSSNGVGISAVQPLYNRPAMVAAEQGKNQTRLADVRLAAAEQALILRVAQAYFDVLQAQDNVAFIRAQKAAITEQLAAARRNFEVGTATITDAHEAQARFDLATAQEIAEQNALDLRVRALEKLIGRPAGSLHVLAEPFPVEASPGAIDEWAERAAQNNLSAAIARIGKEIADQDVERNRGGHHPTLDAVASYMISNNQNFGPQQVDMRTATIGLELNVPIYRGGLVNSRVREAIANQERARQEHEAAMRNASLSARQAWLSVASGAAQVRALEQALVSSRAQLESTKLGRSVGVRTNLDVLNAEQQVRSAQRDLASARYGYLLARLNLKAAEGTLSVADLAELDRLLKPAPPASEAVALNVPAPRTARPRPASR